MSKFKVTTIPVFCGHVTKGWSNSTIVLEDYSANAWQKRVVIKVATPNELRYLRELLDQIEAGWQKELGTAKP